MPFTMLGAWMGVGKRADKGSVCSPLRNKKTRKTGEQKMCRGRKSAGAGSQCRAPALCGQSGCTAAQASRSRDRLVLPENWDVARVLPSREGELVRGVCTARFNGRMQDHRLPLGPGAWWWTRREGLPEGGHLSICALRLSNLCKLLQQLALSAHWAAQPPSLHLDSWLQERNARKPPVTRRPQDFRVMISRFSVFEP